MMDTVVAVTSMIIEEALSQLAQCCNCHRGLEEYIGQLKRRLVDLLSQKMHILLQVEQAKRSGEIIKPEVEEWLYKVSEIEAETKHFLEEFENVKCCHRRRLAKYSIKLIRMVEELCQCNDFLEHSSIPSEQHGVLLPTTTILGGQTSINRMMEEIWACLMDDQVTKIGVYGIGGSGKTTVMKHINNRLLERKDMFDNVFWVTMPLALGIAHIQKKIAQALNLDILEYEDETRRAANLCAKLTKRRYVLIVDDLWDAFSLQDIGIPEPTRENRCKLVFTTCSKHICHVMDCKPIPIDLLSKVETLNLFLDIVGRDILSVPNMERIVKEIVRECGGLPLVIVTIASSLKHVTDFVEWEFALRKLKIRETEYGVLEKLKFSYDRLNDKRLQDCLLYCALFPEDHPIGREELIEYLIVEGLTEERKSWQSQFRNGQVMLNKLVNVCLLNEAEDHNLKGKCVNMHDLVREMAIMIAKDNPRFFAKAGMGLKFIPGQDDWKEDLTKVSLMCNNIIDIASSESPNCPRLSTLLLCENRALNSIHSNFFLHVRALGVLDLSYTSIEDLPESISDLVNLTALLLKECIELRYVPSLARLNALNYLNFCGSGITQLPRGMEMLVELRYLNIANCKIKTIPNDIFCHLSNLQVLIFNMKVRAEELAYLKRLETFVGVLWNIDSMNAYVRSLDESSLANYILQLGDGIPINHRIFLEGQKLVALNRIKPTGECPLLLLPKDVESLHIEDSHISGSNLCELMQLKNTSCLRECFIRNCGGLTHVFPYSSDIVPFLQRLEQLNISGLEDLQGLFRVEKGVYLLLPRTLFSSLKQLLLFGCKNMKQLLMNFSLPNLELLSIGYCEQLPEIISSDDDADDSKNKGTIGDHDCAITDAIHFPKLSKLALEQLPKLEGFSSGSKAVVADSLEEVVIQGCPKLKKMPLLDRELCSPLIQIKVGKDWWESLDWDHPKAKACLQPFCSFTDESGYGKAIL